MSEKIRASLGGTEGSSDFEVVLDLSGLGSGGERHVVLASVFAHDLHVNVAKVLNGKQLALLGIDEFLLIVNDLVESLFHLLQAFVVTSVVGGSQELVVFFVNVELKRMLVVSKQGKVTVGQVSHCSSLFKQSLRSRNLRCRSSFQLEICSTWV